MEFIPIIVIAAVTFGVCFLVDHLTKRIFRSKPQHATGLSVRLNKKYGSFGLIMLALGTAAIFSGINGNGWILIAGGSLIILVGLGLLVYYLTFGIYYDKDSFILNTFGKSPVTYQFGEIKGQQLYSASGNILIELHMTDGRTIGLQASMGGVYPFLESAFHGWCRQTGVAPESCDFYDPHNTCWFPSVEEK